MNSIPIAEKNKYSVLFSIFYYIFTNSIHIAEKV